MTTRRLTWAQAWAALHDAHALRPGVWVDRDGALHLSIPELLTHLGLPVTPDAIDAATETIRLALAVEVPTAEIVVEALEPE